MIVHRCQQGTEEWKALRLGVVTGSGFDEILTPATLKPSKAADAYLARLVAETLIGAPVDEMSSAWMERGTEMEPRARVWYEITRDVAVEQVGFITRDDGRVGVSPDGLVGDDGGLELKVPAANTHVAYALNPGALTAKYRGQVQAALYDTGRKWWDIASYNPSIDSVVERVTPDPAYLAALVPALDAFLARLDAALARLRPTLTAPCPL